MAIFVPGNHHSGERISEEYPDKCGLCGALRKEVEGSYRFLHSRGCQWRTDPTWRKEPKPSQTGHLDLAVRWNNGNSSVNAKITQEQYGRILGIIHEKEPT